jgi:hypothetical protein
MAKLGVSGNEGGTCAAGLASRRPGPALAQRLRRRGAAGLMAGHGGGQPAGHGGGQPGQHIASIPTIRSPFPLAGGPGPAVNRGLAS